VQLPKQSTFSEWRSPAVHKQPAAHSAGPRPFAFPLAAVLAAGEKGLVRNLTPERDSKVALLAALLFPLSKIDEFRATFEPFFTRFKNEGGARLEKLHIAEAYRPGNEDLSPIADEVRAGIFRQVTEKKVRIVYAARRLREGYEAVQSAIANGERIAKQARAGQPRQILIPPSRCVERIEQDLVASLTLLLDAYDHRALLVRRRASFYVTAYPHSRLTILASQSHSHKGSTRIQLAISDLQWSSHLASLPTYLLMQCVHAQ